jgi:hypothetical protein
MTTDTERLDFLQHLTNRKHYTGRVVLRESVMGRGWRLHETSRDGFSDVRKAIDSFAPKPDTGGGPPDKTPRPPK